MSNYYELRYCEVCNQMTNHIMADDTPRHHEYTAICQKCGEGEQLDKQKELK